ncbi:putative sulfite oxidase [Helianthus annuus]|nr:putative sulfite oxidase [Helianthus annuus]
MFPPSVNLDNIDWSTMRLQIDFPVQNFDGLLVLEIVKRDLSNGFQGAGRRLY